MQKQPAHAYVCMCAHPHTRIAQHVPR